MLELRHVSKSFPGVRALDNISLSFAPGEIHALLGENGAGKSTLIKIICGIYKPDDGEVFLNGEQLKLSSYRDAINNRISIVNQEIQVIPNSSIAENIYLDKYDRFSSFGLIRWKELHNSAKKYLNMVGLDLEPTIPIGDLSAAQKQLIQIAKALASEAQVLLLDEPTSSLTLHESKNLFSIVKKLRDEGVVLIFVSHKLEDVMSICDKISVLRDGKMVGTRDIAELTTQNIVQMMIGRETNDINMGQLDYVPHDYALEVENLSQKGQYENINFHLNKGEILGFYGLVGSGRTELAKILIGEDRMDSGEVRIFGKKANIRSMADSLFKYRLGYVSENRKEEGLILQETVSTNVSITILQKLTDTFLRKISLKSEEATSQQMIEALKIKVNDSKDIVGGLSGGNQQKVSLAKWLAADCDILIIDEPSVGVDVGAKEYIHQIIWDLAKKEKKSIILISSDLTELCKLSRRILVFRENKIVGELADINNSHHTYEELSTRIGKYFA